VKTFAKKEIEANTLLKQGYSAETIIIVISDQGYNMIILGDKELKRPLSLFNTALMF